MAFSAGQPGGNGAPGKSSLGRSGLRTRFPEPAQSPCATFLFSQLKFCTNIPEKVCGQTYRVRVSSRQLDFGQFPYEMMFCLSQAGWW